MQFKTLFLIFSTVSLIACSSTPQPKSQVQVTPEILQQSHSAKSAQKGFTLVFPNQDEWTVVKNNPFKIVMTKEGLVKGERYTIQALVVKLPNFSGDIDFMRFIKNRMKKSQKQSKVKVIKQQTQFVEGKSGKCVQYNSLEQHPGKSKPVMLEVASFTCRHTDRENAGVYLAYSKKYSQGHSDRDFNANAAGLFSHMELAAF